jgi:5-methylcytosine-specific restriction protein A
MPTALLAMCLEPGCANRVSKGRCLDHSAGNARQRGYDSRWQRYRKHWLQEHPCCGDRLTGPSSTHSKCVQQGIVRADPSHHVDHIQPAVGGQSDPLFWEPSNHQTLCRACHTKKTRGESHCVIPWNSRGGGGKSHAT